MTIAVVGPLQIAELRPWLDAAPQALPEGLGGTPVTQLVLALLQAGHAVHAVTVAEDVDSPLRLDGPRLRLDVGRHRAHGRTRDAYRAERRFLAAALRDGKPAVVHAHWTYQYALGALASGLPTLITVRDWAPTILRLQPDAFRAVRFGMNAVTFLRGRWFSVTSPYMQRRVQALSRRPVEIVPNAIGAARFSSGPPAVRRQVRVLLAVNNGFQPRKNVPVLLRAFASLLARHPGTSLRLAGAGFEPDGPAQRWAAPRRLDRGVEFLGPVPNAAVPALMDEADVFVHPALEESFGLVLVEAMARGLPVVGGRGSGAVPWVLAGGTAGLLADVRSPDGLAAALDGLMGDHPARAALGEAGWRRADAEFRVDRVVQRYLALYERVRADARAVGRRGPVRAP